MPRLTGEASAIDAVIADLAEQLPADRDHAEPRVLPFVGAGASNHGITQRMDEILADGFGRD